MGYILLTPQLTDSLTHFSPVSWLRNKGPGRQHMSSLDLYQSRCWHKSGNELTSESVPKSAFKCTEMMTHTGGTLISRYAYRLAECCVRVCVCVCVCVWALSRCSLSRSDRARSLRPITVLATSPRTPQCSQCNSLWLIVHRFRTNKFNYSVKSCVSITHVLRHFTTVVSQANNNRKKDAKKSTEEIRDDERRNNIALSEDLGWIHQRKMDTPFDSANGQMDKSTTWRSELLIVADAVRLRVL